MIIYISIFLLMVINLLVCVYLFVDIEKTKKKQQTDHNHILNNIKNLINLINENKNNIL